MSPYGSQRRITNGEYFRSSTRFEDANSGTPVSAGLGYQHKQASQSVAVSAIVYTAIDRIEAAVAEETAALRDLTNYDLSSSINRKSHSIVDFNNAVRNLKKDDVSPEIMRRLSEMRRRLSENHAVIKMHLEAAKEVASLLSATAQEAESDGTYSRPSRLNRMQA